MKLLPFYESAIHSLGFASNFRKVVLKKSRTFDSSNLSLIATPQVKELKKATKSHRELKKYLSCFSNFITKLFLSISLHNNVLLEMHDQQTGLNALPLSKNGSQPHHRGFVEMPVSHRKNVLLFERIISLTSIQMSSKLHS